MHDLIKKSLLKILGKDWTRKEMMLLVSELNDLFPKSENLYGKVFSEYPELLVHLESLLENIERHDLDVCSHLELRKNLLIPYLYFLDYQKAKGQLDWFDKNRDKIQVEDLEGSQLEAVVWFLVNKAAYKHFIEDKTKEAVYAFEEAVKIIEERNVTDLACHIYEQYAETLICSGDVDGALEKINRALKAEEHSDVRIGGILYFTLAKIYMEKGIYDDALMHIDKSINIEKELGRSQANECMYELRNTVLLRQGRYEEAYSATQDSYQRTKRYFKKDHDLQNRALIFLAWAELGIGKVKKAKEHIKIAREFFDNVKEGDAERKGGEFLAYISIVEGEILASSKEYDRAISSCIEAESDLKRVYGNNLKNDFYGYILEKLVTLAKLTKERAYAAHYYYLVHEEIFGKSNDRARRINDLL